MRKAQDLKCFGATDTPFCPPTVQAPPGSCFLGSTTLLNIAFAFGFAIFIAVFVAASFSGGHINPAVTVAFMLTRKISLLRGALYVGFQLGGACLGSAFVLAVSHSLSPCQKSIAALN